MSSKKITFDLDWDALFPGAIFEIQDKKIEIKPLALYQLAFITKRIKEILPKMEEHGITTLNYNEPDKIFIIAAVISENAPDLISEMTGIDIEIISKLPIDHVINLFNVALEANVKSKESLEKNFGSLAETFKKIFTDEIE